MAAQLSPAKIQKADSRAPHRPSVSSYLSFFRIYPNTQTVRLQLYGARVEGTLRRKTTTEASQRVQKCSIGPCFELGSFPPSFFAYRRSHAPPPTPLVTPRHRSMLERILSFLSFFLPPSPPLLCSVLTFLFPASDFAFPLRAGSH